MLLVVHCMSIGAGPSLHSFIEHNNLDLLRFFLEKDADVNQCINGSSPLHCAVTSAYEDAVRVLLDYNASINLPGPDGHTPLHIAAMRGHESIIALLLQSGASDDLRDTNGLTALDWAEYKGHRSIVDMLKVPLRRREFRRIEALAMASHERLGKHSPASLMSYDGLIQREIFYFLVNSK